MSACCWATCCPSAISLASAVAFWEFILFCSACAFASATSLASAVAFWASILSISTCAIFCASMAASAFCNGKSTVPSRLESSLLIANDISPPVPVVTAVVVAAISSSDLLVNESINVFAITSALTPSALCLSIIAALSSTSAIIFFVLSLNSVWTCVGKVSIAVVVASTNAASNSFWEGKVPGSSFPNINSTLAVYALAICFIAQLYFSGFCWISITNAAPVANAILYANNSNAATPAGNANTAGPASLSCFIDSNTLLCCILSNE